MTQPGFFDLSDRRQWLSQAGDPLERLNAVMDWRIFTPLINRAFQKTRKSPAGRKPYNRTMMFKILVLQGLYNLSDAQVEYQIGDRISFMTFLGLELNDQFPDEKTIWSYREVLVKGKVIDKLFQRFDRYLQEIGLDARAGAIVDASIVESPKQRNTRNENKSIKKGEEPESFKENEYKRRQKDIHARWTMKGGKTYYGYKDHVAVDTKHKLIRKYRVTPASTGDIKCLPFLIHGQRNSDRRLWADGAYDAESTDNLLKRYHIANRITHRIRAGGWISEKDERENARKAKIRKRVEHVFGFIENSMGGKFIRTIGIARAQMKIGLMNLIYNIRRYEQIQRLGIA